MKKNYYREKYNKNTDMIKKLYKMLDKVKQGIDVGYDEETIIEAIEEIKEEQNYYVNKLRKNMYNRYGKMFTCEKKYELYQPEFIERENEIIIQANSIDEYVTEIVEDESVDQIEVVTSEEKSCDDQTDILTSKEKCDDKTDVLTSEEKSCDDETDVLTSDAKTEVLTSNNTVDNKDNSKKKNMFKRFKVGLANIAAAALLLIGGIGISGKLNKENENDNSNDSHVEYITETPTEEITTIKDVEVEEVNDKTDKEIENNDTILEVESSDEVAIIEPTEEETDLKIGDTIDLEDTDLYYASTDVSPRGNTSHLSNYSSYSYKATTISVVYKNQVMELVYNDSISLTELEKICKEKYGDDFKISVNFDLVDSEENVVTKYVGWVDSDDVKTKSKTLN